MKMDELNLKYSKLKEYIKGLGSVAVAFSSGVDSALLLKAAHDTLGDRAIAVTAHSPSFPEREAREADDFCRAEGIKHVIVDFDPLSVSGFADNPPNRCYICKRALFVKMIDAAKESGIFLMAEGSNTDDDADYRPGAAAVAELGVLSPLKEAGLSKGEIRALSKELGLPTWDKPSFACLATRFVYGERITDDKLRMVDLAEQRLIDLGFRQVRVRVHGNIARIEIEPGDFEKMLNPGVASSVNGYLTELGFHFVALDLGGYRTGNMNKELN